MSKKEHKIAQKRLTKRQKQHDPNTENLLRQKVIKTIEKKKQEKEQIKENKQRSKNVYKKEMRKITS